jgi:hypothetical protein
MDHSVFDDLDGAADPAAALDLLCARLRDAGDPTAYFYALLMRARHRLGVAPTPTRPSTELPEAVHDQYEAAIRDAGREAGQTCLTAGDLLRAWGFFNMLGEPDPVRAALDRYEPGDDDDLSPILDIALQQNVHPRRGLELVLARQGICSAISAVGAFGHQMSAEDRVACAARLVQALHDQLAGVLRSAIAAQERREPPASATVGELTSGRDWLFAEDSYYIDLSHLAAVVQLSLELPPGPDLDLGRQLSAFGERLPERFRTAGPPPFDEGYPDYSAYLAVVAGDRPEEHLARFRRKAEESDAEAGTAAAEVYVNLLVKGGRTREALDAARQFLLHADDRRLACPGVYELAYRLGDFRTLADAARQRGDAVHYLAARLEAAAASNREVCNGHP